MNLTVRTSGKIRIIIRIEGRSSQETELPRETNLLQVLRELLPNLREMQPPPDLVNLKVIGNDNEEFAINGVELLEGKSFQSNIRLEWGDQIYIPSQIPPTPAPSDRPPRQMIMPSQQATFTPQEFEEFLQQYPPEVQEMLRTLATQSDDEQTYILDLATLTDEQRQALGPDVLQALEQHASVPQQEFTQFTDISLAAININLTVEETLEAYLAIPGLSLRDYRLFNVFKKGIWYNKGRLRKKVFFLKRLWMSKIRLSYGREIRCRFSVSLRS